MADDFGPPLEPRRLVEHLEECSDQTVVELASHPAIVWRFLHERKTIIHLNTPMEHEDLWQSSEIYSKHNISCRVGGQFHNAKLVHAIV